MSEWIKETWKGNPVVYMGDGRNSATFYGPEAEQKRDLCAAAPDLLVAVEWLLKNYRSSANRSELGRFDGFDEVVFARKVIDRANGIEPKTVRTCADFTMTAAE